MYCSNCGKKLIEDAKFCPDCGTQVSKEEIQESISEPTEKLTEQPSQNKAHQNAIGVVYFIGVLNLVLSLVTTFTHNEFLQQLGFGSYTMIYGLVFLVLGFFVQRRSYLALLLAIIIYFFDSLLGIFLGILSMISQSNFIFATIFINIAVRISFISMMIKGIGGIKSLNKFNQNKKYNRLNKTSYIISSLISLAVYIFIYFYNHNAVNLERLKTVNPQLNPLDWFSIAISILIPLLMISVSKRRFHDLGQSGWRVLLLLIPIVNIIFGLILLLRAGDKEVNKYGEPPGQGIDFMAILGLSKSKLIITTTIIIFVVALKVAPIPNDALDRIGNTINKVIPASTSSISMGTYNGRKYFNNQLGVSFTIPESMYIGNNKIISNFYKTNPAYLDDQPSKESLQQLNNEKGVILTYALTHPFGYADNANFQFGYEKKPGLSIFQSNATTTEAYIKAVETQIKSNDPSVTFAEVTKQTINGIEFSILNSKNSQSFSYDFYVTERNGYFLFFNNYYKNDADKRTLGSIISTVKLNTPIDEGWSIDNFQSNISVEKTGEVKITETITADFKNLSKHGISRDLPYVYQLSGKKVYSKISIIDVKLNNIDAKYLTSKGDKYLNIQIGDANKTVSGKNTYQIEYIVNDGILKSLSNNDELYWNVTGNNWTVPITKTEATLILPEDGIVKTDCFDGLTGSTSYCSVSKPSLRSVSFTAKGNNTSGGMTIVVEYKKGMVLP